MSSLDPAAWRAIHAAVKQEIERFTEDRAFALRMSRHPMHGCIGDWLSPELGRRVLELGVGPGRYAALLAHLGFDVVGVDPNRYDTWDTIGKTVPVEFRDQVWAESLPFPAESFDHVVCMGTLLYFKDVGKALSEIRRVLRPGGRLVIRNQNRQNLYSLSTGRPLDVHGLNTYTRAELVKLLREHRFLVRRDFTFGLWPPYIHMWWWYVMNVYLGRCSLTALSAITPPRWRHNVVVFAERPQS
jgi:SAM-dependent methyltransferase